VGQTIAFCRLPSQCGLECAVTLIQQHNFDAAIQSLNEELRQSPRNLKALNLLGIALTGAGQLDEANSRYNEALQIDPHFFPARKNLAVNEFTLNRHDEAATQFEQVLKDAPGDEIAHVYLGELSFENKQWETAAAHYRQTGSRIAQNQLWVLHYAKALLQLGSRPEAIQALKLLFEDDAEGRFQAGLVLGSAGAYDAAAGFFGSARKGYSDPYTAGYNQVLMLIRAANYNDAIRISNELFQQGYKRAELYNLVSEAYSKAGRLQEAYDSLRTATTIEPGAEDNYADLAALCLDYENYPLGLDILNAGMHYIPNSYRLYVLRGVLLVMSGLLDQAEKEFNTASKIAPDKLLPYIALAELWMQNGQPDKAVELLRPRLNRAHDDYLIPYIYAVAVIRSGAGPESPATGEAVKALEESVHANPNFSHSHAELGNLLLGRGEVDRAIAELELAMKLDPTDASPAYKLAQAYKKKGQSEKAREMLARVSKLHSQELDIDLKKDLKRLVRTAEKQ
jgi:tetratricopeptide (TPR) repeat protein